MILEQTSVITLDYNPATDILQVDYPDMVEFHLTQIEHSLKLMVNAIINYDVKKLLLDASKTSIEASKEENTAVTMQLAADLYKTRLQKVARIQPTNVQRETIAQENINQIKQSGLLPYQLRTFTNKPDAIAWLVS